MHRGKRTIFVSYFPEIIANYPIFFLVKGVCIFSWVNKLAWGRGVAGGKGGGRGSQRAKYGRKAGEETYIGLQLGDADTLICSRSTKLITDTSFLQLISSKQKTRGNKQSEKNARHSQKEIKELMRKKKSC